MSKIAYAAYIAWALNQEEKQTEGVQISETEDPGVERQGQHRRGDLPWTEAI